MNVYIKIMLSSNKKPEPTKAGKTMSDLKNILDLIICKIFKDI